MRKATLVRSETGNSGTFGVIQTDSGFSCYTGELPWLGNQHGISCIPDCVVQVQRIISTKHGPCYCLVGVPGGRTMVEIHVGNFCGDVSKGLKSDVEGCIILGNSLGEIGGQPCVISSKDALARFEADLECQPFILTIKWGAGIGPQSQA